MLLSPGDQTRLPEEPSGRMRRERPGGNREGIPGRGNGRLEGPQMQMGLNTRSPQAWRNESAFTLCRG